MFEQSENSNLVQSGLFLVRNCERILWDVYAVRGALRFNLACVTFAHASQIIHAVRYRSTETRLYRRSVAFMRSFRYEIDNSQHQVD